MNTITLYLCSLSLFLLPLTATGVVETATIEASKALIDHATVQSDRWLFLASLLVGFFCFIWLVKYFTCQLKTANEKAEKAYQEFYSHLIAANKELVSVLNEHGAALRNYTSAIESNTAIIKRILKDE
jgi:hypothetical protein